jgi:type 1 glutamine amidotransferase
MPRLNPRFIRRLIVASVVFVNLQTSMPTVSPLLAAQAGTRTPRIVILIGDDDNNYEAQRTIPIFAKSLASTSEALCRVILARGEMNSSDFPELETALERADLLVIFFRRRALPEKDLAAIRNWLKAGKPLVGIRTANHAFNPTGDLVKGHSAWESFVPDVLGCGNYGYGPVEPGTDVQVAKDAEKHAILKGVAAKKWYSKGNIYRVAPIDKKANVLLWGTVGDSKEPIAWTRMAGKSRVFYTSLGHPSDFDDERFVAVLTNGMLWAAGRDE